MMLVLYRTRNPFLSSAWTATSSFVSGDGEDNGLISGEGDVNHIRGRIEDAYHDDPSPEIEGQAGSPQPEERTTNESGGRGPVMQPSTLHNEGNEWRDG